MSRRPHPLAYARGVVSVRAFLLGLLLTPLATVTVVRAASAATPASLDVGLRYDAIADCPSREAFLDLVRLRAPHVRLLEPDPTVAPLLEVVVVFRQHPRGAAGQARISLDGRVRDERDFVGGSCLEVARATALSVAFVLETQRAEASPAEESTAPLEATAPSPGATVSKADSPGLALAGSEVLQTPPGSEQPQPPAGGANEVWSSLSFDVGLAPVAANLLDAPWLLGGGLSLGARSARGPRPSARLSVLAALSGESDSAASRYRWIVGEALLCPYRLGDEWSLAACAHGLAGVMHAEGDAIDYPLGVRVSWFSIGPSLKGSVSIGSSTRLVATLSASVPLAQRTFVFERPRRVVAQTHSVGWLVSVGVEHDIGGG